MDTYDSREALIYVNGRALFELIADAERPFETTEGAGDYVAPPPKVVLKPRGICLAGRQGVSGARNPRAARSQSAGAPVASSGVGPCSFVSRCAPTS